MRFIDFRMASAVSIVLCALLSACQDQPTAQNSASVAPTTSSGSADVSTLAAINSATGGRTTGKFDERTQAAVKKLVSGATVACVQEMSVGIPDDILKSCPNEKLVRAIEPTGAANEHCIKGDNYDEAFKCALMGAMLIKLREQSKTPLTDEAWVNLTKIIAGEMAAVGVDESFACAKEGKANGTDARSCMADYLMYRFGGRPEDGSVCIDFKDDWDFGKCLGEAAAVAILEDAALRV